MKVLGDDLFQEAIDLRDTSTESKEVIERFPSAAPHYPIRDRQASGSQLGQQCA
jgi:hypothetical protein